MEISNIFLKRHYDIGDGEKGLSMEMAAQIYANTDTHKKNCAKQKLDYLKY